MTFNLIDLEYSDRTIAGVQYTSRCRILLRSPQSVLYAAGGSIHLWKNREVFSTDELWRGKFVPRNINDPRFETLIDDFFGKGCSDYLKRAYSEKKTVIMNGGGDPLFDTQKHIEETTKRYNAVTPSWAADLSTKLKKCCECGSDLKPHTSHISFANHSDRVSTLEECQRLTNHRVVEIKGMPMSQREELWPLVEYIYVWDEETYLDPLFCNDKCAASYGRRAVRDLERLPAGGEPNMYTGPSFSSVTIGEKEEKFIMVGDKKFRV